MRPEPRDPGLQSCLLETSPHPRIGDRQATDLCWTGKDPIALRGKLRDLPPGVHDTQHLRVHGYLLFGFSRFHVPDPLTNDSSLDQKCAIQPIHIRPLECKSFTHPKPESNAHKSNCVNRFIELFQEPPELLDCQAVWFLASLCCALNVDEFHWISLWGHNFGPHREIPQLVKHASNMYPALRRQSQRLQPKFNRSGL